MLKISMVLTHVLKSSYANEWLWANPFGTLTCLPLWMGFSFIVKRLNIYYVLN